MPFFSYSTGYRLLKEEQAPSASDPCHNTYGPSYFKNWRREIKVITFLIVLITSNIFTFLLSSNIGLAWPQTDIDPQTPFAHLERNVPIAFEESTPYTNHNETTAHKLWEDINIDAGMVALPEKLALANGLPIAQRFPWDPSKGIYLLNGHHNLHCIRAIYISLIEFWHDRPQSRSWGHVIHCVDALRQDIICNADDTPRYSTATEDPTSGVGQVRRCRSWEKLERWARGHNACYRYVNQTVEDLPEVQRFIYCPLGSPYRKEVEKVFGKVPAYEELALV